MIGRNSALKLAVGLVVLGLIPVGVQAGWGYKGHWYVDPIFGPPAVAATGAVDGNPHSLAHTSGGCNCAVHAGATVVSSTASGAMATDAAATTRGRANCPEPTNALLRVWVNEHAVVYVNGHLTKPQLVAGVYRGSRIFSLTGLTTDQQQEAVVVAHLHGTKVPKTERVQAGQTYEIRFADSEFGPPPFPPHSFPPHVFPHLGHPPTVIAPKVAAPKAVAPKAVKPKKPQVSKRGQWVVHSPDLVALYTFEEGKGNKVKDLSKNGLALDLKIEDMNAVRWVDKGLEINKDVLIKSYDVADKINDAVVGTGELTIEAWVTPSRTKTPHIGPERIVSLSKDTGNRNFTIGQLNDKYEMRLRTDRKNANGTDRPLPSTIRHTLAGTAMTRKTHLVLTYDGHYITVYLNGVPFEREKVSVNFKDWDKFHLLLGNELNLKRIQSEERPWRGTLYLVAIYKHALSNTEVWQNFQAGCRQ